MKIFSITSMGVLLLGAGVAMHSTPARAALPIYNCYLLAQECAQGDQQACQIYSHGCKDEAPQGSTLGGVPSIKGSKVPDKAPAAK